MKEQIIQLIQQEIKEYDNLLQGKLNYVAKKHGLVDSGIQHQIKINEVQIATLQGLIEKINQL